MNCPHRFRRILALATLVASGFILSVFAACTQSPTMLATATATPTRTPFPTATPSPTPLPPTPTPSWPVTVFVPPELPSLLREQLTRVIAAHAALFVLAPNAETADLKVTLGLGGDALPLGEWVYAAVAPFPTYADGVTWADIAAAWCGQPVAGAFSGLPLRVDAETAAVVSQLFPCPAAEGSVRIEAPETLLSSAWEERPAWAIVPFEALEPRWKVLRVDGASPLSRTLDTSTYPLVLHLGVSGVERGKEALVGAVQVSRLTNRDPEQMAVVVMSGVTAMTRGMMNLMNRNGAAYAGRDIRDWFLSADISHTSNEIPFADDCPATLPQGTMTFCARPEYIELFDDIGLDVVELTGNHELDWGVPAMLQTMQMYEEHGIRHFGGGWDLADAQTPLTMTVGSQRFAFLGCNPAGGGWASENVPGSAPRSYCYDQLPLQIRQLRDAGYITIVTMQYREEYEYFPAPDQEEAFRALVDAGAVIVQGSQAHQPQSFEFYNGSFIHYGLGNTFFDQMWSLGTRQGFVDRHTFYAGRHISTELLTAILEEYTRPRPMTEEEREELLRSTFEVSNW